MAWTCKFCESDFATVAELTDHQSKTNHTGIGEQEGVLGNIAFGFGGGFGKGVLDLIKRHDRKQADK